MVNSAQLSVPDLRGTHRHPVDQRFLAEHRRRGEIELHLANISAHGFMTASATGLSRGERVVIRLPHIGRIEAHLIWTAGDRAGFQFERILRSDDFAQMIATIQPNRRRRPIAERRADSISD
jgi:hypothetical protein